MKNALSLPFLTAVLWLGLTVNFTSASCLVHTGDPAPSADDPPPQHFDWEHNATGDWGGLRNLLSEHGVEINGSYVTEPAGNPSGGFDQGITYLHNIDLSLLLHLDRLVGIPHTTFLFTMSQRSGSSLSAKYIGNAISVQQIFGGGETFRLVQMRLEHHLFDDRLTLAYGRLTATSDFLTSPLYCQFVNNGICGQPPAPFFNMPDGITAYPAATWGALVEFKTTKETYIKGAVYDGDPNAGDDRHGANFGFGDNGVLLLWEIGCKPEQGLFSMPGRYSLGGYYHTGHFPDVARDVTNGNIFLSGLAAQEHGAQEGFYLIVEQMLHRNPNSPKTGLNSFLTFVLSPEEDKSAIPYYLNGGLIYQGLIPGRPEDKTALGFYSAWFSSTLRGAQRSAGLHGQTNETDIEFNHQVQVNRWLYFRPNIQYVIKPNGLSSIRNALVLGVEAGVTF